MNFPPQGLCSAPDMLLSCDLESRRNDHITHWRVLIGASNVNKIRLVICGGELAAVGLVQAPRLNRGISKLTTCSTRSARTRATFSN